MTIQDPAAQTEPQAVFRKDYHEPPFRIDEVELTFVLGEEETLVRSKLSLRRNTTAAPDSALILDGEELATRSIAVDGRPLAPGEFAENSESLELYGLPDECTLETEVAIRPQENTSLSGLYKSSGNFCTQCEAEGFRRITWFLDRPDVMARYRVTIEAEHARYPVLLANGNRVAEEDLGDGRHRVVWEDPFPKPSYLFALVGGQLEALRGSFATRSGRDVALEIWVAPEDVDACGHALASLKKSMAWDEETFGLEYDLDVYMIVAVSDFNMGAMENKGLNIFNTKYVLARPETATDDDYNGVEAVIAHEYFHNWTGNRVTCRDWFQLTLKEGLTVYRDQLFSADQTSAPVQRVGQVRMLRLRQFSEDAGPMAHPIRPESYIEMNNFYTATVYEKGAEVVRMYATLLGRDGFRKGMDLYFERHDGSAVTCDDFRAAMADANGEELAQFERWYLQPGTPVVSAKGTHDPSSATYTLTLSQSRPDLPGFAPYTPMLIPVRLGLMGEGGDDLPLRLAGETSEADASGTTRVLRLTDAEQTFVFEDVPERPVPSLFRDFSAPVKLEMERGPAELAFQLAHDSDAFNRWEAGQVYGKQLLLDLVADVQAGRELVLAPGLVTAFQEVLADQSLDRSIRALTLTLPDEGVLAQELDVVDPDAIHTARMFAVRALARGLRNTLEETYARLAPDGSYRADKASIDRRRLRNRCLSYLASLAEPSTTLLVWEQFESADNMTDASAALRMLVDLDVPERERALDEFHERWKDDPLVLDKWFTLQAVSMLPGELDRVKALAAHPDFRITNPNRVRSLISAFTMNNQVHFHQADGAAYRWLADRVLEVDPINGQLASRLVSAFNPWRRFDAGRQALQRAELERIVGTEGLSKDVYEIATKALA